MSEKSPSLVSPEEQSRDRLRLLLTVCCALAIVIAATVVPAVETAGLGNSPIGSVVPQPNATPYGQQASGGGGGGGGGGSLSGSGQLGALNAGDRTSVGGSLTSETGSSAFRSQNAETHFTVQSSTASYWRTGAYDTYTGSGWEQIGDRKPYDGELKQNGIQGQRVQYQITLDRPATSLPSVWQPTSLSQLDSTSVSVTDERAFVTDRSIPPGTTYTGVSYLPPRDPTVLRTAGQQYPERIHSEYTQLPADIDPRVSQFTQNLTRDASSPYETATQIESWLESNKTYSLNVSTPPDDDVASQFMFDMDAGYCEYFATTMTVMLRSQDIPARYVVGYSTGQQVGENTYRVRGMNAHAWVEVYFPDVGWVRFDPTPGAARLQAEQQAFEQQGESGTYSPTEQGSPAERFTPNGEVQSSSQTDGQSTTGTGTTGGQTGATQSQSDIGTRTTTGMTSSGTTQSHTKPPTTSSGTARTTTPTTTTTDSNASQTEPGDSDTSQNETSDPSTPTATIELDRTPVPGAMVTVTVTRGEHPLPGKIVRFNGKRVGTTDEHGAVTARVPYARSLTITVNETTASSTNARGGLPHLSAALVSADSSAPSPFTQDTQTNETVNSSQSYSLATNITLTVSGDTVTGNTVVVTATIEDVPVSNARVQLDNRTVGRTDAHGRLRVQLPDAPGNVSLLAGRGPASGQRTITLPTLTVMQGGSPRL
ncbi:transglutaminase family protein [Haladaptatus sp. NG-SE-30]